MMVLCEDTTVADKTKDHFSNLPDENGNYYDDNQVMVIHSELTETKHGTSLENARKRLYNIDNDDDPLRVVISVLMLREGFDKNNICFLEGISSCRFTYYTITRIFHSPIRCENRRSS